MTKHLKWILPTILVVGLLALAGQRLYRMAMSTPMGRQAKLVDCTGAVLTCSFTPRKAHVFSMVMATPELTAMEWDASRRPPFEFVGRVQISTSSQQVVEFEINSLPTRQCNWLQRQGAPVSFILSDHLHTNNAGLQQYLTPGQEHRMTITFERAPPTNASIWMTWHERYEDFRKN